MKKAGTPRLRPDIEIVNPRLLSEQHVARMLDRLGNSALMLGRKMGVLARQNFACVGDVTAHQLRRGERNLGRSRSLCLLFGGAHV